MDAGAALVVIDGAGRLVATSAPDIAADDVRVHAGDEIEIVRREIRGYEHRTFIVRLDGGVPLAIDGRSDHRLFVLRGRPGTRPPDDAVEARRGLAGGARRMIWTAILVAGAVAIVATGLVTRPIVRQVSRLRNATQQVRAGALDVRVPVTSGDELGELEQAFNTVAAALERGEHARRRMISDAAHELRTPLTNTLGHLEAVRDGLRAADRAMIESTHEEAVLLRTLIDELQTLSVAESGALHYHLESLVAQREAQRAADAARAAADAAGVQLVVEGEPLALRRPPASRPGDRQPAPQRRRPRAARQHCAHPHRAHGRRHRDCVCDEGQGIPPEHLPLVWERFHRVDPSRARTTGGMGLGLAVVRQLVTGMGGAVEATSTPGRGSTFTIILPLR